MTTTHRAGDRPAPLGTQAHSSATPHPRRAFLRSLSGGAAALGLPLWLTACGGGGDDATAGDGSNGPGGGGGGDGDGAGGGGASVDGAVRAAAIAAVEEHCRTLSQQDGMTPLAFVETVAAKLRTNPVYVEVGVDVQTLCAWGVFADGRIHVIANNLTPQRTASATGATPARRAALAAAALSEVPGAARARVMQTFGPMFDGADVVTDVVGWLREKGWQVPHGDEHEARLSTLRGLQGDGYFYINTHGGAFTPTLFPGSGQGMYAIQSSTLVSPAQEALEETIADMAARRLTYFTASNGNLIFGRWPDWDTRYGLTSNFVDTYWKFASDSAVIINACSSARTNDARWSAGFVFACHKAGAGVYLGWDNTVAPVGAYRAARYFTDRMLGANKFQPESPAQRPFPWDAVMGDMQKKSLHIDPGEGSVFLALPNPASMVKQLLAPSIRHLEVSEYMDELRLIGRFGSKEGEVTVDGQKRTIKTWESERIVVDLPRTGSGSRGAAQVTVHGVKSNLRQLTEWTIPLDYTYVVLEQQGLKIDGLGTIRLRADVGGSRDVPGEPPVQSVRYAYDTRDSQLPLTASGSFPTPKCTLIWTGQATYKAIPDAGHRQSLMAYLKVDTTAKLGWLGLALGTPLPDFVQTGCGSSDGIQPGFGPMDAQVWYPSPLEGSTDQIPLHALALSFDTNYRIVAGHSETVLARVIWSDVLPVSPPLPTDGA
ncbi:hypothetical protein BURC_04160 [Burkholderiaceae bacterium]|nr:hypothetical protein BURC_04160 [Burkholderiaceae bacterium]